MSIIVNQSLFPVIALNLGTTVTEDIKDKKVYKLTKHYFAVFCIKTPNRVYFIEGNDNVVVPKLSELLKLPSLALGKCDFEIPLPANVINNFIMFLKDPTMELSGFYMYDLFAQGFITSDYFANSILNMIMPLLSANDIEMSTLESNEIIKLAHKAQASKMGLSGDSLTLKDRLKSFVNHDHKQKQIDIVSINNAVTVDAVTVDDNSSVIRNDKQEKESLPELTSFDHDLSDTVNVDLSTMNKTDLLGYANKLGLIGLTKTSTVEDLKTAITEKLTDPSRLVPTSLENKLVNA